MKIIICPHCFDAFRASFDLRVCLCGASQGRICSNSVDAETAGRAVVVELDGFTIAQALVMHHPDALITGRLLP